MPRESGVVPPRYANVEQIARGGVGEIYSAEDTELERRVAVKVLADRFADDEDCKERFKREALAAARLSGHPHVATIYDVGEWNEHPYLVMAFLPGGTIADRLADSRVGRTQALRWLEQTADALDAAHAEGIVHRDVKPANLLLDQRGDVVVADFGIARVLDQTGGLTASGTVLGTAGYLSPEQAKGEGATAESDTYSLGVVAYELLTGHRPFEDTSPTAEAAAHIRDPVPPASARANLPTSIDAVFDRALAKDPGARFGSAGELVAGLENALSALEQPTLVIASAHEAGRPRRSRVLPLAVFAVLLLAGGALAGVLLASNGGNHQAARVRRVVVTHTLPGTTVRRVETVTTANPPETVTAATPAPPPPPSAPASSSADGHQLNDQGYALMNEGRYSEALPLLQQAVQKLNGTGPTDPYEAYADYNLAYTFIQLGRCSEALPLLNSAERLEGRKAQITAARQRAERC
jgi:eukaryotic-like serine/threonine-protein kinase